MSRPSVFSRPVLGRVLLPVLTLAAISTAGFDSANPDDAAPLAEAAEEAPVQPADGGRVIAYDDTAAPEPAPSPSTITVLVSKSVETQMMIWDKSGVSIAIFTKIC